MKATTLVLLTILMFASCGDRTKKNIPVNAGAVYTNACCCNPTVAAGAGLVFIPSMFTPNGDGLNDMLRPLGNVNIKFIYDVKISDAGNNLLYTIDTSFGIANAGSWNGYINAVSIHKGILNIDCKVIDVNNVLTNITAQSCAYICDSVSNAAVPNILNCKFETMLDPQTFGTPYGSGESFCY